MVNFLNLPGYNPGNALDFSSLSGAIDSNRQNALQQNQLGLQREQVGMQRERLGMEREQHGAQQRQRSIQTFASHAQKIDAVADPVQRKAAWDRLISSHPDAAKLDPIYRDPMNGPKLVMQEAEGFMGRKETAQVGLIDAQAQKARREAVQGPETFGKAGTIVQGPDGGFYTVQFGARGERKIEPLQIGGEGGAGQRLAPAKGVQVIGDEVISSATGGTVRNVAPQIAGGEAAKVDGRNIAELRSSMPKAQASLEGAGVKAALVREKIKQAIPMVSNWTTGYGAVLSNWPATAARDFKGITDTIIANLGFDELAEMRANSPTGGALGQVAVQELDMLQRAKGSLEQAQSPQQVMRVLQELDQFYAQAGPRRQRAFQQTYAPLMQGGTQFPERAPQAQPQGGSQGMIPPAAVQLLRGNPAPEIIQMFEQKYGPGSARQFLGGQ